MLITDSKYTSVNSVAYYHFFRNLSQNSRSTGNAVKHVSGGVTVGFVLYRALSVRWLKVKSQPGLKPRLAIWHTVLALQPGPVQSLGLAT